MPAALRVARGVRRLRQSGQSRGSRVSGALGPCSGFFAGSVWGVIRGPRGGLPQVNTDISRRRGAGDARASAAAGCAPSSADARRYRGFPAIGSSQVDRARLRGVPPVQGPELAENLSGGGLHPAAARLAGRALRQVAPVDGGDPPGRTRRCSPSGSSIATAFRSRARSKRVRAALRVAMEAAELQRIFDLPAGARVPPDGIGPDARRGRGAPGRRSSSKPSSAEGAARRIGDILRQAVKALLAGRPATAPPPLLRRPHHPLARRERWESNRRRCIAASTPWSCAASAAPWPKPA